jgi:type VI secretion system protein ImpM
MAEPAAWYGKLPSLGDFASRRLSPGFIEPWDAWLAGGLAAWRAADPEWLQAYLAAPSWRFVLEPQALAKGSPAVAGVLVPSVDSAGRYFPLTLVHAPGKLPGDAAALQALLAWLHKLDDLAVDALQDDWSVPELETQLVQLGTPDAAGEAAFLPTWAQALAQAATSPARRSWWWCTDAAGTPCLMSTSGLPRPPTFAALLAGDLPALSVSMQTYAVQTHALPPSNEDTPP